VKYELVPRHPVDRVDFRGLLGLSEDELRRVVTDRFGRTPSAARAGEVADAVRLEYRRRGYLRASVTPRVEIFHDPDRATLVIDVQPGPRARILDVKTTQVDATDRSTITDVPGIRSGQVYDEREIGRELQAWEGRMRSREFYEARASHSAQIAAEDVFVLVNLVRGPHVTIRFEGDLLPENERERLVPVRAEGSVDEDLLEDSNRAIETYLHSRGYRDANVQYTREETAGELIITFRVKQGPRYLVRNVAITGNRAIPPLLLMEQLRMKEGEPFVQSNLSAGARAIENLHLAAGFIRVQVKESSSVVAPEVPSDPDRHVSVTVAIVEGPRAEIRSVAFQGNMAITDAELRAAIATAPGRMFSAIDLVTDRDAITQAYHDRGFESVVVATQPTLAENDSRADVRFTISEGPQIIVDHVIISGNRRISSQTIAQEILLREGEPYGESAVIRSRANLRALELFRNVQIEALAHTGETRRDVLVQVEEAPSNAVDVGGGIEGGYFLRPTGAGGVAEERFEVAPRGSFQFSRRNLWGKNRSLTLFTRVGLRTRDTLSPGTPVDPSQPFEGSYGFHEYRVLTTYREPRVLRRSAEFILTGMIEQAPRASFNFSRREVRALFANRFSRMYTASGSYAFQRTKLFDLRAPPDELPLIDRLFPQVRLSKFTGEFLRDGRDDPLDPSRGTFAVVSGDLALRAIGSEVGFIKTYLQGFWYRQLPVPRRTIVALGGRLGAAHGFDRELEGVIVNVGLPASERFFAGGDTTVRGFALDRLGNEQTITPTGFPTGGNSVVILNSELRVDLFGAFQGIGFVDAGNVFPFASDLDFTDLRPSSGFGVVYRSQRIGVVSVGVGFNLDPKTFVPGGEPERRWVPHILLGHTF
jgi:outer membrane protein insertion porin family